MPTIDSTQGVHVHADLSELTRIRHQLTASQLAIWGDHSSRIAAMFGMANNDIADLIFNDCGLVLWAIENPELGLAVSAGLTAVWMQLANLNSLCDLVETRYQAGELTIDRKMALEHQMLEVAAIGPVFAKLNLDNDKDARKAHPIHKTSDLEGCLPEPVASTGSGVVETPVSGPTVGSGSQPVATPAPLPGGAGAWNGRGAAAVNIAQLEPASKAAGALELQDSEKPQDASGYKGSSTQN